MTVIFVLATTLSIYGIIVGFCASPQGLSIRMTPLSQAMMYNWHEVQRITVVCYRRGRGGSSAFEVSTRDGTTIDLYDQAGSFTSGYIALTEALRDVPVVYERDVQASCDSTLLKIQWPGVIIRKPS